MSPNDDAESKPRMRNFMEELYQEYYDKMTDEQKLRHQLMDIIDHMSKKELEEVKNDK